MNYFLRLLSVLLLCTVVVKPVFFTSDTPAWAFEPTPGVDLASPAYASGSPSAGSPIKIVVEKAGMYAVSYADITKAGWDPSGIDPTSLKLESGGLDIAMLFVGEGDREFNSGDYFLFYGEPAQSSLTHHSEDDKKFKYENIYWLTAGADNPKRMYEADKRPNSSYATLEEYTETLHLESEEIMINENIDHYVWKQMPDSSGTEDANSPDAFSFSLTDIDTAQKAVLRIRFKGGNDDPTVAPDHHGKITLNNTWTADCYFDGVAFYVYETEIPANILKEGSNEITVANILDTGAENLFYLDYIEIEYRRYFSTTDNHLLFSCNNTSAYNVTIDGFDNESIALFDITYPDHVITMQSIEVRENGSGGYAAVFGQEQTYMKRYLALTPSAWLKPGAMYVDETSDLKNTSLQADYIMIAHEDFYTETLRLAEHRRSDGYTVTVVKVQDVYDEFNYGILHPQAIKDFLGYAYESWARPAPTYVLLVGDGCSDATDTLKKGSKNFIPCKMRGYDYPRPTDTWYAAVKDDSELPMMYIGRLPVKSAEQLSLLIDKIIDYETAPIAEWMRNIQFVGGLYSDTFHLVNGEMADLAPFNYYTDFLSEDDFPGLKDENSRKIIAKFNAGRAMTFYTGHSNITDWTQLINTSHFGSLDNYDKPTFLVSFSCWNGGFSSPLAESFTEEFVRTSNGGGLACFSPAAGGNVVEHRSVGMKILNMLFNENRNVLGAVCTDASIATYQEGLLEDYSFESLTFLGDPATKINLCDFYLESPADETSFATDVTYSWVADGYTWFAVQFSPQEDFSGDSMLTFYTYGASYEPGPVARALITAMAQQEQMLYWRVGGLKSFDELQNLQDYIYTIQNPRFTAPWSLSVE